MDTVINAARSLGKIMQSDERYTRYIEAQKANNGDAELQEMIGRFNFTREALNTEMSRDDKDTAEVQRLDAELKAVYADIFKNANMIEFTEARGEMETMVTFINQIVTASAGGEDPETIEFQQSCGGDCGGCSGCS